MPFALKMFIPHCYIGKVSAAYIIKRLAHVRSKPNPQLKRIYIPERGRVQYSILNNSNNKIKA